MYQAEDLEAVYQLISDKDVTRFFPDYYSVDKADVLEVCPDESNVGENTVSGNSACLTKKAKN